MFYDLRMLFGIRVGAYWISVKYVCNDIRQVTPIFIKFKLLPLLLTPFGENFLKSMFLKVGCYISDWDRPPCCICFNLGWVETEDAWSVLR